MNQKRLAKAMSDAGYCSRRDAEKIILESRVAVDGKIINTPAFNVTDQNKITIDGKALAAKEVQKIWLYHKPAGLVTTHKDPQDRPTVFENLPAHLPRVISVGRLDLNSEGLLLLTNSGDLARKFELPSNNFIRVYKVRVNGYVDMKALSGVTKGITIEGQRYRVESIKLTKAGNNSWLEVELAEGKNREVRKIFAHFGLSVNRLIRISYGPYKLGDLKPGEVAEAKL
jgi:23S rRNA pseudouridine2605 synthase